MEERDVRMNERTNKSMNKKKNEKLMDRIRTDRINRCVHEDEQDQWSRQGNE